MALARLLLLELSLHVCGFICGIITAASVTISQGDFAGKCMLYAAVGLNHSEFTVTSSSSPHLCYFVSAISVCVAIFCFSSVLYWVYTSYVEVEGKRARLWLNLSLGVCGVFLFFFLVTGCILKVGRDALCNSVLQTDKNVSRCEEAQNKPWEKPLIGSSFYSRLHTAETAVWVNFFSWVLVAVLVFLQRRGDSEYRSQEDDPGATSSETEPIFNRPGRP